MSAEGANLPQHITGAEQSQALQNVLLQQERAQAAAAAESSRDRAREQSSGRVQEVGEVEDTTLDGGGGGGPHVPDRRPRKDGEGDSGRKRPPDPDGRGRHVDVEA